MRENRLLENIYYIARVFATGKYTEIFVVNTFFFASFQLWSSYDHFPFRPAVYAYIIFYRIYINTYPAMFSRVTSYIYIYKIYVRIHSMSDDAIFISHSILAR